MKLTDALLGEHAVIYAIFDYAERAVPGLATLGEVQTVARMMVATLGSHARVEEQLLFPALDTQLGPAGPLAVMRQEHEDIDEALEAAVGADSREVAARSIRDAIRIARSHFSKEERVLFMLAHRSLSEQELDRLGDQWSDLRQVALG